MNTSDSQLEPLIFRQDGEKKCTFLAKSNIFPKKYDFTLKLIFENDIYLNKPRKSTDDYFIINNNNQFLSPSNRGISQYGAHRAHLYRLNLPDCLFNRLIVLCPSVPPLVMDEVRPLRASTDVAGPFLRPPVQF